MQAILEDPGGPENLKTVDIGRSPDLTTSLASFLGGFLGRD